jgi:Zn-dependent peptidase ImmA (M78 family)
LWANGPANALLNDCLFFDQDVLITAHHLTTSQVDFILMHELGHVVLDHPRRYKALKDAGGDVTPLRHEFEYSADTFAVGLVRSRALNGVRYILNPNRIKCPDETEDG